ncbi:MAG: DUF1003 domain-containing protein [Ahrensia sp.]|nr:DUF1003 domain-containing protein [Ahrensia sp.]
MMEQHVKELAERLLNAGFDDLPERERRVIHRIADRIHISKNINREFHDNRTFGQRLADQVAEFGGSWSFISLCGTVLAVWIGLNTWLLGRETFDPYPFVFLNLILSMLAALQAPIIMMSQNRQSAKDRLAAANDYEINLKAELEIISLHEKFDQMRNDQLTSLIESQERQIEILTTLVEGLASERRP